jgi:FtsP/CotA-like multicopper oxidase with cupredoxin domain
MRDGGPPGWVRSAPHRRGPVAFEVFSIRDDRGIERLDEPVWRDTIILHEGWTVKFRTRYADFAGRFVQHCHILDHEDQGMMELIEISP